MDKAFPQRTDLIIIVIDGAAPELADAAAIALAERPQPAPRALSARTPAGRQPVLDRNGLLSLSREELAERTEVLIRAQPLLGCSRPIRRCAAWRAR